jgi:hypothetical protein
MCSIASGPTVGKGKGGGVCVLASLRTNRLTSSYLRLFISSLTPGVLCQTALIRAHSLDPRRYLRVSFDEYSNL